MAENKENWPRDADDLVNGIPETVKAAKSMGHVPAPGNDPDAQLRASKALAGLGIEVPAGIQSGPVLPADRRAAVERQNAYAEGKVADLLASETSNPVQVAADIEAGGDGSGEALDTRSDDPDKTKDGAAEQRAADAKAAGTGQAATVKGRAAGAPKSST